jgi:hypothetical protein
MKADARPALAIGAFACTIFVKEMAYMLPFMAALLTWHVRKPLARCWPLFAAAAAAVCARTVIFHGTGEHFGSNGSWLYRAAVNFGGGALMPPSLSGDFTPIALALVVATVGACLSGRVKLGAAFAVGALLLCALTDYLAGAPWGDSFLRLPYSATQGITALLMGAPLVYWIIVRDKTQSLGYAWFGISYIPLLFTVTTEHTLYLPSLGWALWLAVPLVRSVDHTLSQIEQPEPLPQPVPVPATS